MAVGGENMGNVKRQLVQLFELSLRATVPSETDVAPLVDACFTKSGAIMKNLSPSDMAESCSVAGPGFVNVVLSKNRIAQMTAFSTF
ncbi:arginine--tRNA ligase, chloroplastic/mitochondrial-like [Arachis stenosperma]|uniref:arginine--tRNA ligase, chloroplastic/mitochondrial-like n=1 Tax=Arachis stenosperma TaxID=217475 RepID=UPI0025ACE418|nr:arginine--tRNA ligase, chloroplastic/mitochondrial-like [Arachis stenosperma]